ncbi:MAG: type VI secretion system baseplate subunit TssG [Rubrivivax sp.]|nr:type VI secretion system baseplate subunit TssG [Rubrivivax sp.]
MSEQQPNLEQSQAYEAYLAAVAAEPYRYDFYQVLRRIAAAHPRLPPLGQAARPVDEPVRVAQPAEMDFAPAPIHALVRRGGSPPWLMQRIFGLLGSHGALPLHLTEYARERERHHGDPTFQRFLDTFTHRFALLFYRAWADAQPAVSLDRPDNKTYFNRLGSLVGIGLHSLQDRDALPDSSKIHFAGRLARQTRDAEGLLAWLRVEFDTAANVEQWCGHWMPLTRAERTRLGRAGGSVVGRSAVLGGTVWDVQHKFRITLGPLSLDQYQRFLPGGRDLARLQALVRHWVGIEFAWDVKLILHKDEVPRLELGSQLGIDDPVPPVESVAEGCHDVELVGVHRHGADHGRRIRLQLRLVSGTQQGALIVESAAESCAMYGRIGQLLRSLVGPGLEYIDAAAADDPGGDPLSRLTGMHAPVRDADPPESLTAADPHRHARVDVDGDSAPYDEASPSGGGVPGVSEPAAGAQAPIDAPGSVVSGTGHALGSDGRPGATRLRIMTAATVSPAMAEHLIGRRCRIAIRHERMPDGRMRAAVGARAGLGHTTWLGRYLQVRHADDLRLDVERPHAEA